MSDEDRKKGQPGQEPAAELVRALGEAYDPSSLDPSINEVLIEQALSHFDAASTRSEEFEVDSTHQRPGLATVTPLPNQREREAAERLRTAFDGALDHPLLDLAQALKSAYAPTILDSGQSASAVTQALGGRSYLHSSPGRAWPLGMGLLAMAAGAVLWFNAQRQPTSVTPTIQAAQLAQSRTLSPLFAETIEHASPTQRIDRIYAVRSRELRQNRFVTWGVR